MASDYADVEEFLSLHEGLEQAEPETALLVSHRVLEIILGYRPEGEVVKESHLLMEGSNRVVLRKGPIKKILKIFVDGIPDGKGIPKEHFQWDGYTREVYFSGSMPASSYTFVYKTGFGKEKFPALVKEIISKLVTYQTLNTEDERAELRDEIEGYLGLPLEVLR